MIANTRAWFGVHHMDRPDMLAMNKSCWDTVALQFRGVTSLPVYGPFMPGEDELRLLGDLAGARVLEVGCGDGHSLKYMAERGALDLHGLDFSPVQIHQARGVLAEAGFGATLHCSPMEEDPGLPKGFFDIVLSIYALGWSTDLDATLSLICSSLKPGGCLVFSWEHPFYTSLEMEGGVMALARPYTLEGPEVTANWRGSSGVVMQRRMLSTWLNALLNAGFQIERVIEPVLPRNEAALDHVDPSKWYNAAKASMVPTTFLVKARKPVR